MAASRKPSTWSGKAIWPRSGKPPDPELILKAAEAGDPSLSGAQNDRFCMGAP
jgi:hypothetical protein